MAYATSLSHFLRISVAFFVGILITPFFSNFFYSHKLWKRSVRSDSVMNPGMSQDFNKIHNAKTEGSTPRIGLMDPSKASSPKNI